MNNRITDIKVLKNSKSEHAKKAEKVIDSVLIQQKVNVDVVSGATTTSKALLKAIENAVKKGIKD